MSAARPKGELTAFDVLVLAEELGDLSGSYMDKIVQPSERELVLRLKKPGADRRELVVEQGRWAYLRSREAGEGAPPPPFSMLLRKHLENGRVLSVAQHGFERILVLSIEGGYELVLELFGEGNVILVQDGVIIQPLRSQSWEHREVRAGQSYLFPPSRTDPRALDKAGFARLLASSKGDLVRTLAVSVNLGGRYAEEVCARTGLARDLKAGRTTPGNARALRTAVNGLFSEMSGNRQPTLYLEAGTPVDFAPVALRLQPAPEQKRYPDLNSIVSDYLAFWRDRKAEEGRSTKLNDEIERVQRQAENQENALKAFQAQAVSSRRAGEAINCDAERLTSILRQAQHLRQAGGWNGLEKAIAQKELPPLAGALPHEGRVLARLRDTEGNELEVLLDVRQSARENAGTYFTQSRESSQKARRTAGQLEESRRAIAKLESEGLPDRGEPRGHKAPRKTHWFERFRWFLSSDGNIVIGGKDAASNDRVVKRHLGEGDAYAHADFHGAPSVVVKRGPGELSEKTLRQACLFALACSKAWSAGLASGSAYWVHPDQVSKTPESGEYLPRGGFIIRGRKNTFHDLELRLALGIIDVEGARILMCGPPETFKDRGGKTVEIQPGDEDAKQVAKRISSELGCDAEEARRLLPPGKSQLLLLPG